MTGLRTWFVDRSLREKRLLVVMGALLVITIVWAGIVIPIRDGLETSRARYEDAVVRLATTRSDVDLIKAAGRRAPLTASLADTVRAAADQAGFEIATLDDQDGGRVHVDDQFGSGTPTLGSADAQLARQGFLTSVFGWMFVGLALTAGIAAYVAASGDMLAWFEEHSFAYIGMFVVEIGLVIGISAGINRISASIATLLFALFAAVNGFTLSVIIEAYTTSSIASAFVVSAGMFGGMATYGYVTKRDLSSMGSILFMGLIGVIIGSVVNIFWANSILYWFVTFAGVLVFCGLTAYDMQKLKKHRREQHGRRRAGRKASIIGALSLYLDFINLFLFLLRIFGSAR